MKVDDQQDKLVAILQEVLKEFDNYGEARVRGDGDIQISLDPDLKRARSRGSSLANAFSQMMSDDLGPKRSSTWVE
jgi:hypothetical protein|tara:strand:- start:3978 stop:4205 length:228 start_codon:yes stop_codon:yes gene_type:complete